MHKFTIKKLLKRAKIKISTETKEKISKDYKERYQINETIFFKSLI